MRSVLLSMIALGVRPVQFNAKLYDELPLEPADVRRKTLLEAHVSAVNAHVHYVIVHNLSSMGLLVASQDDLQVGAEILFDIPDLGRHLARVVWRKGTLYDCTFVVPIPAEQVRRKLTGAKVVWGPFADPEDAIPGAEPQGTPQDIQVPTPAAGFSGRARILIILGAACACWLPLVLAGLVVPLKGGCAGVKKGKCYAPSDTR